MTGTLESADNQLEASRSNRYRSVRISTKCDLGRCSVNQCAT